ncbi:MAG: ammonium transporter [Candidatus Saccharibacteria bacterium]
MKLFGKSALAILGSIGIMMVSASSALASDNSAISAGDTTWVLVSAALVLLMTPGLAMFYGGMVRKKNILSILMQCFMVMGIVSIQWVIFGYSLAFGPDVGHVIGSLKWLGLSGVGLAPNADYAATIPHQAFVMFQLMFAIITAALLTGAFAERMNFGAFVLFSLLWVTFIYEPLAHWVWGTGGWLKQLGIMDFAGGYVVEICSGFSSLAAAIVIGRRKGYGKEPILPHNMPYTVAGAGLLWFGWFGFNAGSALAANEVAVSAFIATNTAAAAGTFAWAMAEWIEQGKPTVLGAVSGAVAALVAITPACGYVSPLSAMIIGLIAGPVCYFFCGRVKQKFGYDDSLDVFGVHGVGGVIGCICLGIMASQSINPVGMNGLMFGNVHTFLIQLLGIAAACTFAFTGTFICMKITGWFVPLRVTADEEDEGLDTAYHGQEAYSYEISA